MIAGVVVDSGRRSLREKVLAETSPMVVADERGARKVERMSCWPGSAAHIVNCVGPWAIGKQSAHRKKEGVREQANVVDAVDGDLPHEELPQVIFETNYVEEARNSITEVCCFVHSLPKASESQVMPVTMPSVSWNHVSQNISWGIRVR